MQRLVFLLLLIPCLITIGPVRADDAVTVTFDAGPAGLINTGGTGVFKGSYIENGFQFDFYGHAPDFTARGSGRNELQLRFASDILIHRVDGGTFDLVSFDFLGGGHTGLGGFHGNFKTGAQTPDVGVLLFGLPGHVNLEGIPGWRDIDMIDWCDYCIVTFDSRSYIGNMTFNVAAVPEPETYAMLIAGLSLLGFMVRRKKRQAVVA